MALNRALPLYLLLARASSLICPVKLCCLQSAPSCSSNLSLISTPRSSKTNHCVLRTGTPVHRAPAQDAWGLLPLYLWPAPAYAAVIKWQIWGLIKGWMSTDINAYLWEVGTYLTRCGRSHWVRSGVSLSWNQPWDNGRIITTLVLWLFMSLTIRCKYWREQIKTQGHTCKEVCAYKGCSDIFCSFLSSNKNTK